MSRGERDLAQFRNANNIDAITPRYTVDLAVLGELDRASIKSQADLAAAGQLASIQKQKAENNLQLSPEQQMYVENDPELRFLAQTKLQLQQQRAVALSQNPGIRRRYTRPTRSLRK